MCVYKLISKWLLGYKSNISTEAIWCLYLYQQDKRICSNNYSWSSNQALPLHLHIPSLVILLAWVLLSIFLSIWIYFLYRHISMGSSIHAWRRWFSKRFRSIFVHLRSHNPNDICSNPFSSAHHAVEQYSFDTKYLFTYVCSMLLLIIHAPM